MLPVIIFDFGGVLLDWDPRYLYRKIFNGDEQAMERFFAETDFFNWNLEQDAGRPFAEGVKVGCEKYPGYCELLRAYDSRWRESIRGPIWETVEILKILKQANYRLFGLSNWSAEKFQLVRGDYDFLNWFEGIVISGEERLIKPDPRIFTKLLALTAVPAADCLLIDDSRKNLETAARLGFQVAHYQNPELLRMNLIAQGIIGAG